MIKNGSTYKKESMVFYGSVLHCSLGHLRNLLRKVCVHKHILMLLVHGGIFGDKGARNVPF